MNVFLSKFRGAALIPSIVVAFYGPAVFGLTRVEFSSNSFDFGKLERNAGTQPMLDVVILNSGTRAVRIDQIEVGCGCISIAPHEPFSLVPGAHKSISATLDFGKMRPGAHAYPLRALSAGAVVASGQIQYHFAPRITLLINQFVMGIPPGIGQTVSKKIDVKLAEGVSLATLRVVSNDRSVQVKVDESGGGGPKLIVTAKRTGTSGWRQAKVDIFEADSNEPVTTVVCDIEEPPDLVVSPRVLMVEDRAGNWSRTVRVTTARVGMVFDVRSPVRGLSVSVEPVVESSEWIVTIRGSADVVLPRHVQIELFDKHNPETVLAVVRLVTG